MTQLSDLWLDYLGRPAEFDRAPDKKAYFESLDREARLQCIIDQPDVFEYLSDPQEILISVSRYGFNILKLPLKQRTAELYQACVIRDPTYLAFVPVEFQTEEMVLDCVRRYAPAHRFSKIRLKDN